MVKINNKEFKNLVENIRMLMREKNIYVCFIYGDEYRRENLRYISNYWL